MLLKIYRTNQPIIQVLLPVLILVIWFPSFFSENTLITDYNTPIFKFFLTESKQINQLEAIALILGTAFFLNDIINQNEFFRQNLYLPALIVVLFASFLSPMQFLHPILFGNFALVLVFRRLINIHSQVSCKSEIFDASLLLLTGALFYPPLLFYSPIIWIILLIFRPFQIKEWLTPFLAAGLFFIYFFVSLIFSPTASEYSFQLIITSIFNPINSLTLTSYPFIIISLFCLLLGMRHIHKKRKSSSIRYKKMTNSVLAFLLLGVISTLAFYWFNKSLELAFTLFIPLALTISYFFIHFKKKIVAELILFILFVLVIIESYM